MTNCFLGEGKRLLAEFILTKEGLEVPVARIALISSEARNLFFFQPPCNLSFRFVLIFFSKEYYYYYPFLFCFFFLLTIHNFMWKMTNHSRGKLLTLSRFLGLWND